jgi:hypothetical protein
MSQPVESDPVGFEPVDEPDPHGHVGSDVEVPHVELDETVPPRPEEEIANLLRSEPDVRRAAPPDAAAVADDGLTATGGPKHRADAPVDAVPAPPDQPATGQATSCWPT